MQIKKQHAFLLVVIAIGLSLWWYNRPYPPKRNLTAQQEKTMQALLKGMKTRCVGRYLVDLPASFSINKSSVRLEDNNWVGVIGTPGDSRKTYITTKRMYYPAFEQFIKRREREIANDIVIDPMNKPNLKGVRELPNGIKGVIFERNVDSGTNDALRTLEGYFYTDGVAVKVQKESVNDTDPRYEKDRAGDPVRNYVPKDIERMKELFSRIRGRQEDDIPSVPGSCIAEAFIAADKDGKEQESISQAFISDKFPGVEVFISIDNYTQEENTVLERSGDIARTLAKASGHITRKGSFDINGLHAEELLATIVLSGIPRFGFALFINEMHASYKAPTLTLTLNNASKEFETYPQEEITAFWDAITHSIHMRPNAFYQSHYMIVH
ncbi:T6SS immunity protein Tli4 family protein [Pseudescherichia vulneris]